MSIQGILNQHARNMLKHLLTYHLTKGIKS
jgi:hypothetical protein